MHDILVQSYSTAVTLFPFYCLIQSNSLRLAKPSEDGGVKQDTTALEWFPKVRRVTHTRTVIECYGYSTVPRKQVDSIRQI